MNENSIKIPAKAFRPQFIDQKDEPWIRALIEEYKRFESQPLRAWKQRLKEPLPFYCPQHKLRFVLKAFADFFPQHSLLTKKQCEAFRLQLFAFGDDFSCAKPDIDVLERRLRILQKFGSPILAEATKHGESLDSIIFADLPSEKRLAPIPLAISLSDLILTANTLLIKSIIQRSQRLDICLRGKLRPIVRQALLRGLICVPHSLPGQTDFDAQLSLSGPLGLFRHTRLYGRLLIEIVPFLPNCDRFALYASVPEGDRLKVWLIQSGDPIRAAVTKQFDSQIERNFARQFTKAAPDFDLIQEPQAIQADGRIIFPDFAIKHRTNPDVSWLLEIVGYWTNTYLRKKIESLQRANIQNLILCVSRKLACSDEWPKDAKLILFDRWIDPAEVMRVMGFL